MALSIQNCQIVARPNQSMSSTGMLGLLAVIAFFSILISIAFGLLGAWLVLPFAGLELLALGYAFYYVHCHSGDYESITIDGDRLAVEKRDYKQVSQVVLNRHWARVSLRELPGGEQSLLLRAHGKEIEFGRHFLNNEQRQALAQQLKKSVGVVL